MTTIDVVMPARNEAPTVAANVVAARGCASVREVVVVDDGSSDGTGDRAREAGAKVVTLTGSSGSKARAMSAGVAASDAEAILFVDADCTGLTSAHLDAIVEPFVRGDAAMSIGAFDYGWFWNPMVVRWPPLSGERIIPREVFESIPPSKLEGYTIEIRINEVIASRRLPTTVRTMRGVSHRTKRDKHGAVEGWRRTYWMYRELLRMLRPVGDVRWRTYWWYLRNLTVARS
jgi:glycosyltransferase involved in cell wall biosynthesis